MPITINGTGTITGINAGGLPDGVITTDDIAANAVTLGKIGTTEQGQLCKAWVNFNGTGTVAIRASFNVSSITDNGVGDYTVNFTTALPDANYGRVMSGSRGSNQIVVNTFLLTSPTTSALRILCILIGGGAEDTSEVNVAIFR